MTDIHTKELRRLMDEATPGPWTTWHNGHYWEIGTEADAWFGQQIGDMCASEHMYRSPSDGDFEDHSEANAALIVAMHNALPALLSEAEEAARLREELAALRAAPAAERSWEKYALAEAVNTSQVELNREAVVDLVREAVRFAVQAAGEGFCAAESFLFNYSTASGDEDLETLADRLPVALSAALAGPTREAMRAYGCATIACANTETSF